jgi:fatty-acyl-CoA synthase
LAVRYYDWIAHFGRRTPDKVAAIDLASQRRFTYAQLMLGFRGWLRTCAKDSRLRAAIALRCWR